jgi:beta-xylosidase
VGDDHYIVTSSFEYFPGVPVWHSRDLIEWTQIANALSSPSQLSFPDLDMRALGGDGIVQGGSASTGVFAPTIRHHDGLFWLTTTNFAEVTRGPLIVHAERAEGPWSEPVFVTGLAGIDSDLTWDDDGTCLLTIKTHGECPIATVPIDPRTGEMLGEQRRLWGGTGGNEPEGPHLYRRGEWWYLLLAEGGTERGHSVTVARAKSLDGPWESNPSNPILTHRGTASAVQNTGHADFVQLAGGEWAMVHLGVRPRGNTPGFHVNGRETFLTGITWVDDWPVVDEDRFEVGERDRSFADDFSASVLHPRWISPGGPLDAHVRTGPRGLTVEAGARTDADAPAHRRLLAMRPQDQYWSAEVDLDLSTGSASLALRIDDAHHAEIRVDDETVVAVLTIGPAERRTSVQIPTTHTTVTLYVRVRPSTGSGTHEGPDEIELGCIGPSGRMQVDAFDGRYLSTEVATGFTGRVVGILFHGGTTRVTEFRYSSALPPTDSPASSTDEERRP